MATNLIPSMLVRLDQQTGPARPTTSLPSRVIYVYYRTSLRIVPLVDTTDWTSVAFWAKR